METGNTKGASAQSGRALQHLPIRAAGLSDAGCVRTRNEDAFLVDEQHGLFLVADGIGGHPGGDIAARMVVEDLPTILWRCAAEAPTPDADDAALLRCLLLKSLWATSERIRQEGERRSGLRHMGAAAVVAWLTARHAHIVHLGDCRAYLWRWGQLQPLTEDHSVVSVLVRQGEVLPEDAETHPAKGCLTRFAGMPVPVVPAVQSVALEPGDRILLCTDGLWGMLRDGMLAGALSAGTAPARTCQSLIVAGRNAGGLDNLTAVVVDVGGAADKPLPIDLNATLESGHEAQPGH